MRLQNTSRASVIHMVVALQLIAIPVYGQATAVRIAPRAEKTVLPKEVTVKNIDIGPPSAVSGLPLPDLTIKDAYLDEYGGFPFVNFLIANIGTADAGPFEVAIQFNYKAGGDGRRDLTRIDTLKAGESVWIGESPICCGWSPTEVVVKNTEQFVVIADAKYTKLSDPTNPLSSYEVPSRITESNKGNNKYVINKADMRHGKFVGTMTRATAAPVVGPLKQAPIKR